MPPELEDAVQEFIDESHAKTVVVLPLTAERSRRREDESDVAAEHDKRNGVYCPNSLEFGYASVYGALVFESFSVCEDRFAYQDRCQLVARHGGLALKNALAENHWLPGRVRRRLAPVGRLFGPGRRGKTTALAALLMGTITALIFVPADFKLEGAGTLEPSERRDVFAENDGIIEHVNIQHGAFVDEGDLLLRLGNTELEVALADVVGRRNAAEQQMRAIQHALLLGRRRPAGERQQLAGELAEVKKSHAGLSKEAMILQEQLASLDVRSPFAGQVLTWQAHDHLLGRPVRRGQRLLSLANPRGEWHLEVEMSDHRIGHVVTAQEDLGGALPVEFVLASHPETTYRGEVLDVHSLAEVKGEEGNTVLVRVALDRRQLARPRPGVGARARVFCGRRSLGYVWLHELIAFVRTKILFRL